MVPGMRVRILLPQPANALRTPFGPGPEGVRAVADDLMDSARWQPGFSRNRQHAHGNSQVRVPRGLPRVVTWLFGSLNLAYRGLAEHADASGPQERANGNPYGSESHVHSLALRSSRRLRRSGQAERLLAKDADCHADAAYAIDLRRSSHEHCLGAQPRLCEPHSRSSRVGFAA